MKFFIDTANMAEIKKAYKVGVLSGVTTNPSLVAKEGVKFEDRIAEILQHVPEVESVSAEVTPEALTAEDMIAQANELIKINNGDKNITIKLPMTLEGLEACRYLTKKGVKTNVTLIFTVNQALLPPARAPLTSRRSSAGWTISRRTACYWSPRSPSCSACTGCRRRSSRRPSAIRIT